MCASLFSGIPKLIENPKILSEYNTTFVSNENGNSLDYNSGTYT